MGLILYIISSIIGLQISLILYAYLEINGTKIPLELFFAMSFFVIVVSVFIAKLLQEIKFKRLKACFKNAKSDDELVKISDNAVKKTIDKALKGKIYIALSKHYMSVHKEDKALAVLEKSRLTSIYKNKNPFTFDNETRLQFFLMTIYLNSKLGNLLNAINAMKCGKKLFLKYIETPSKAGEIYFVFSYHEYKKGNFHQALLFCEKSVLSTTDKVKLVEIKYLMAKINYKLNQKNTYNKLMADIETSFDNPYIKEKALAFYKYNK